MDLKKGDNVVVYLTGDIEKDKSIKRFCKDKKLNIIKKFKSNMESEEYWNSALFDMYFEIFGLREKYYIRKVITYDLETLFWCTFDQVAIAEMLFDSGAPVFTLKEGDIYDDEITKLSLNIPEKNIKNLRKYWVKEDKEQNKEDLKNEKNKKVKVALYVYYDGFDIDYAYAKEKKLRDYCKDKNYDIVATFRSTCISDFEDLDDTIKTIIYDSKAGNFDKVIFYQIDDISEYVELQVMISNIIEFCGVSVETIKEGIMNEDFVFTVAMFNNYKHKEELEPSNNKYLTRMYRDINAYQCEKILNSSEQDLPF